MGRADLGSGRLSAIVAVALACACGQSARGGSREGKPVGGAAGVGATSGGETSATASGGRTANGGAGASAGGAAGARPSSGGAGTTSGGSPGATGWAGGPAGAPASTAGGGAGPNGGAAGAETVTGGSPSMVETSAHYIVFAQSAVKDGSADQLMLLDLAGGDPIRLNPTDSSFWGGSISRDGRYLASAEGHPPETAEELYLSVFTDHGYMPPAPIDGFDARDVYGLSGFDPSSRFAAVSHTFGFDIVDATNRTRFASRELEPPTGLVGGPPSVVLQWPSAGDLLAYGAQGDGRIAWSVATVNNSGIGQPVDLPANVAWTEFSADGKRFFYAVQGSYSDPVEYGYVEPPGPPLSFYVSPTYTGSHNVQDHSFIVEPGGASVVATLLDSSDPTKSVAARVFVNTSRSAEIVSDPQGFVGITGSASGALTLVNYDLTGNTQLMLVRGTERFKVATPKTFYFSAQFAGEHLVYTHDAEMHDAQLDASGLVNTIVSDPDRDVVPCVLGDYHYPPSKAFYLFSTPQPGIRLVNLNVGGSPVGRSIEASDALATIACPTFSLANDAAVYVEQTDAGSKMFLVHFGADGPSEPELVLDSTSFVAPVLVHP